MTGNTHVAFALTDSGYGTPGITVEDAEGRAAGSAVVSWPHVPEDDEGAGEFQSGLADAMLDRMGFCRTGPWEWHSPQWVAGVTPTMAATEN